MRRQGKFFFASTAAVFIMTVVISSSAPASSLSGYWILDTGYWVLDTRFFHRASSIKNRVSRINDLDAEAAVQRNTEILGRGDLLPRPIASSPRRSSARQKSPGKAFLFSAAVPGTGQFYSGARRGVLFIAAEVALWTAYIVLHRRGEELKEDYLGFVDLHIAFEEDSPVSSTKTWTLEDYEHATQSDNWHYVYTESNGKPVERVGKFYWADLPEDMIVQPGDKLVSQFRAEAFEKRGSANEKFKQSKLFLGLVVLNHIISAVDGRIAAIIYNDRISETSTEISFHPTISPSGHPGAHLTLRGRF